MGAHGGCIAALGNEENAPNLKLKKQRSEYGLCNRRKDKDHPNSVHTKLVEQMSSYGGLYKISASEILRECDDCFVLEG